MRGSIVYKIFFIVDINLSVRVFKIIFTFDNLLEGFAEFIEGGYIYNCELL